MNKSSGTTLTNINTELPDQNTNQDSKEKIKTPFTPFTPFTPNTLDSLKTEINKTDNDIKTIVNNMDNTKLTDKEKDELWNLVENQEYLVKQHKKHVESKLENDVIELESIKNKVNKVEKLESQIKDLKENLIEFKDKLDRDTNNKNNSTIELETTRKVSDGDWKQNLT